MSYLFGIPFLFSNCNAHDLLAQKVGSITVIAKANTHMELKCSLNNFQEKIYYDLLNRIKLRSTKEVRC